MTHDVSRGFRGVMKNLLKELGYGQVAEKL